MLRFHWNRFPVFHERVLDKGTIGAEHQHQTARAWDNVEPPVADRGDSDPAPRSRLVSHEVVSENPIPLEFRSGCAELHEDFLAGGPPSWRKLRVSVLKARNFSMATAGSAQPSRKAKRDPKR